MNNFRNQRANLVEEPPRYSGLGFFVSRRTGTQTFPANTLSVVDFDTAVINDNGCYNFGTKEYVCSVAGRMSLSVAYSLFCPAACDVYLILQTSNTPLLNSATTFATTMQNNSRFSYSNSLVLNVNVGTTLQLRLYPAGGSGISSNVLAEESCFFCGYYLP